MNLVSAIRKSRIRSLVAVLAVAGSTLFALVPTAGATSLRETPHFQCYSYSNGTAMLVAETPKINEGQNYTSWMAHIYRWNSSSRTWGLYVNSKIQTQNNAPFSFGELTQENDSYYVAPHSFYEVKYEFRDNTDSSSHYMWATPIMDHYGANSCWT
jgi:hypothetical protein